MAEGRGWSTATWEDPDGGSVLLHGTFPTVVHPRQLWPDPAAWEVLALLEDAMAPEAWLQEEEDERASPGINLEAARFGIGHEARLLETLMDIKNIRGGCFPDPEPLRLFRAAQRSERPVYFLEPSLDDEAWSDHLSHEATERTHWRRLLKRLRGRSTWAKALRQAAAEGVDSDAPNPAMTQVRLASRAWWSVWEDELSPGTRAKRDDRLAARLRGVVRSSREGGLVRLLVVLPEPRISGLLEALQRLPQPEVIVSYDDLLGEDEEA